MQSTIWNQRYRLKKKYFNGVLANEVRTTSLVQNMTDEEWIALVAHWSDPKNKVCSNFSIFFQAVLGSWSNKCMCLQQTSEKYKQNRQKVKFHQTTGSHAYVPHLHAYVSQSRFIVSTHFSLQCNMWNNYSNVPSICTRGRRERRLSPAQKMKSLMQWRPLSPAIQAPKRDWQMRHNALL